MTLIDPPALPAPPANIEGEQALLGALLVKNDVLFALPVALTPDSFYEPLHQRIFAAVIRVVERGGTATPLTLKSQFDADPSLADLGGGVYLSKLAAYSIVLSDAVAMAEAICDLATRRKIIYTCRKGITKAEDLATDCTAGDVAASVAGELDGAASENNRYRIRTERDVTEEIYNRMKDKRTTPRFSTGLSKLDAAMDGGMFSGKLYGIVGRKKHGKTMLASTISTNLQHAGTKHLFLALEMGSTEIHQRSLAGEIGCYESAFRSGFGETDGFLKKLANHAISVKNYRHYLDAPGITFADLRHLLPAMIRRYKLTGYILDCWQLVGGKGKGQSTAEHLDAVAQWLAECCKRYGVWGLVTAQENQDDNTRGGEGIRLACDQLYRIGKRNVGDTECWLDMMETRYTGWQGVGAEGNPGLQLSAKATHFEQMG